jgi:DNA invertase Pin-like site-specific DNA recombinase
MKDANTPRKKVAALYARVSTRDKEQDPEVQLIKLREYAKRLGYEVYKEYTDYATGKNPNRPGLVNILADAKNGRFDAVIIVRLDRIMRSLVNLHHLLEDLEARNVRLVATDQQFDTMTTTGRLMLNILGSLAQWESEQTRDRVLDGLAKARSEGHRLGRPPRRVDLNLAESLMHQGNSMKKVALIMGVPRSTLTRRMRKQRMSESQQNGMTKKEAR